MRTRLRGKVTLLFMILGILLAVPTVALAADLLTEAELSSQVSTPTIVAPNATTNFDIKVWARGSIANDASEAATAASIGNAYTMGAGGDITFNGGSESVTFVKFQKNHNYGTDGQFCPTTVPAQSAGVTGKGCATDPFIVPATLTVGNLAAGTNGTLSVAAIGANSMVLHDTSPEFCSTSSTANDPASTPDATDCTRDQGFVRVNTAPVANNDTNYNTNEDTPLNEPAPGVLGNDTDADNTPLTAVLVSGPSHAAATNGFTLNADGTFTYTPDDDFNGEDTFTYKANDGTVDSGVATVTITVASANDAPTCQNVAIDTAEDEQGSVAAECSDVDGDTLTYEIVDQATDGTATVDADDLKYDPEPNFNGSDSFTYRASDGTAFSDPATVAVTVSAANDAPTIEVVRGGSCGPSSDMRGTINLALSDPDDPPESLTLSVTSSNQAVLPDGNISFGGGTDAPRTMTVSSLTGSGTSDVTITVSDGDVDSSVLVRVISGSAANNTLTGGANSEMIFARKGSDTVSGRRANDLMCGGNGNDKFTGGLGADHFGGGSGTDTATDFNAGEGDTRQGIP